ncbi:glycosyl transferase family protein [Psychromonas sp. CNPT3]|uniref:glycosyltransferase n=1 Tax=Psychromonas sp. CNPT3 TaxID=314282 RepID=UPI0002C10B63|nr:glycosyltransferase [Psychromonas sp. CNPT3]AGH81036.1 glycosyl transferase family protein [Psychromonas sp. CNPT3]
MNFNISFIIPYSNRHFLTNDDRLIKLVKMLVKVPCCEVVIDFQGEIDNKLVDLAIIYNQLNIVVSQNNTSHIYSPGQARNRAVAKASGEYLFFIDADLLCQPCLLSYLLERSRYLSSIGKQAFEMFPCFYLTEKETKKSNVYFEKYLKSYLSGEIDLVENIALASSCLLVNREWFIALGGFDVDFIGHGGEDLTLIHQLALHYPIAPLPNDYSDNIKSQFPGCYQGFRRYFSLYALAHLFAGRFFVHCWHPRPLTNAYHKKRESNDLLLVDKLNDCSTHFPIVNNKSVKLLQKNCLVDPLLLSNFKKNYRDWLSSVQEKYDYPVGQFPGLFNWADGVKKRSSMKRKFRKLYLNPRLFFIDMFKL